MSKKNKIKHTHFGENTGSYYGIGKQTEETVTPSGTIEQPVVPPPAPVQQEQKTTEGEAVVPQDKSIEALQGILKSKVTKPVNDEDTGLGIDYSSYKLRQWNKDKNKKVKQFVTDNAMALPEVAKVMSVPEMQAKVENDKRIQEAFQKLQPSNVQPVQQNEDQLKSGQLYKNSVIQANQNGIPEAYGYSEKIPMAVQKSIIGKVIPSLAPDEEKQQYVKDNGLEKIQPNANVKLYSDIQKGITSNNFLVGIDDRTKEFQNNQLDVSSLDKTTKLAKVGEDIDKLYSQVITKQRDELKLKDPDLKAFNDSQVNYTQIVNNIKELQKDDSVKQLELLLPKHGELMKAYKEKTLAIQPKLTEVLKQRDEYLSGLTKDEKGQYIVNPDEALIKVKDEATQYYNSLIEESKKNKEGEIKVSDADLVLARQKVLLAQDEIDLNIKQKETEFYTITKANIDNVKGQDVLQIEKDITELEQQDIVKAYFDKTNPVINNYTDNVKLLDDAQLNLDATKLKAEEALRKYQSTDKNEIKYAKSIEDLKKTLIELNKKEKTAWLLQLANKYGDSLTPEIIQNEYIKATNAFRYNDIAKAGFVPMVSVKEDDKIKEVLYSQEYQFASTLDKKIMLNEYYSEVKPQGLTRQNFFTKYQKYIYEPLDVILLKTNAEELKLRSSIERKTHPELYRGTYADAIQGKDIIGGVYFKSENQIDSDLADKIIDRITSLPSEKQGVLKDFWKGLKASEAKDWMPVLGGLVDYVEQKRIYEAYRAVANNIATFEQARLVRTIDSFKTIQSKFGQDTFTSYNVGNKYFPQMMRFIGEISVMSGTSKLIEAGLSEFEIVQMIGKQFNKATSILGASEEMQVVLSKIATRPAGILLRAFASSQTVGIGSTLAKTYEKLTPFVLSKVDPETLKIKDYKLQEQQFTSFAKAYLKSSIQQSIEYGTEELGFLVDKPIKYIVGKRLGDIALRVEKFSLKSKAVRSFMDMLSNPETGEILLKGALYTKLKELAPYLTMKGGALTYGQVHSIPAEAFEEVLADLLNNHLDDAFENKRSTDMDTDGYVKGKFKETVGIMLPLTAMSTLLGVGNIALKSFHIAKTESYKADELDVQFLNLNQAQAASFAFPFGRHKRKNLKAYMSLVSDIIEETEMNDEKVTNLTEQIDFLEKNREIKLARLATALLEKRLNFEDEKVTDTQSFKEYYEQFKEESTKLKSFIQGTLAEGAIDHTAFQSLKSQVSDKRILDEIEHLEIAYAEFENQKSNKLIPDNYTFKNFYQKENAELEKIQSTLYNYIAGGGSINFNEIKQAISTISLSTQKYNELTNLVQEAQEIFVRNQNVIVDDIIFSPEGTKRRFTDLSKEESDKRITLAQNKANTGMFANTGTSIRITKDVTDKDGNNFDIKVNPQGEVHFVDDFNYDKFKKFILEELGHLPEMARKAYFYTLAQNKSLTFEQKANLLQMINNKLAEDLSEQKIVLNEGLKQMALLNQALKDLGITYAADIQGERPTNGVIAYAFMKGNFNYDKDSAKFFLTNEEYRLAKGFLNAMKNYSQLISNDKISNLENRLVTDRSYTLTDPNEDDVDTILDALQQNDITSAIVGKNLKKKDVIKYLSELKENKQISRSQLTAIAQVIMNTARNFKRMGIIKSESEFLDMLPQMKQLQVNMTESNKKIQKEQTILLQNGEQVKVRELPDGLDIINGFYSPIEKTLRELKSEKWGSGQQALAELKSKGLKADEVKWTGIEEWLKSQGKVTKQEILDYLKDNRVQLVEVVKSDRPFKQIKQAFEKVGNEWEEVYGGVFAKLSDKSNEYERRYNLRINGAEYGRDFTYLDAKSYIEANAETNPEKQRSKFSQYQLEGDKSNYREILVTMPSKEVGSIREYAKTKGISDADFDKLSDVEYHNLEVDWRKQWETQTGKSKNFKSSHWDELNIIGHLRLSNRVDAEGNKVLHISEVQSDWGQEGKKEGFSNKEEENIIKNILSKSKNIFNGSSRNYTESGYKKAMLDNALNKGVITQEEYNIAIVFDKTKKITPTAPFVTNTSNWTKLLLKYAIREAVKDGATKITWETGETQNERYDLSKQVDYIDYWRNENGTYGFSLPVEFTKSSELTASELEDYLGKEVAKKIVDNSEPKTITEESLLTTAVAEGYIKQGKDVYYEIDGVKKGKINSLEQINDLKYEYRSRVEFVGEIKTKEYPKENKPNRLQGDDLKVGGKGMIGFYGSPTEGKEGIVGKVAKELVRELTGKEGKIGETEINVGVSKNQNSIDGFLIWLGDKHPEKKYNYESAAKMFREDHKYWLEYKKEFKDTTATQHSIEITPELKASVIQGIPLFQKEDKIKGIFNPIENIIIVLKTGDISTVMHELAHSFKFLLQEAADNGNVKAQEKLKVFQDFANSEEGKRWYKENIQQEGEVTKDTYKFENELFARAFERYLRDGSYSGIQDGNFKLLLNEFKEWLKGIYEDIKSGVLNIKLTKEMRNMFEDISGNRIDIDKDLMSYIESKFGRFSERKNITKEMLFDLLKEAEKGIDPEIHQKAMESLHKIFALYKKQYIGQRYKSNSRLINPQLRSLLNTPRHNVIEMYRKDIKNFEEIIDNSRYRFTYQQMINQRKTTVQRFISNRKENLDFWTEMKKLATIEHRSIDSQASMENYIKLLRAKPEDFGVDQLKKMTEKYINDSEDYKISKLNSNKEESEKKDIHVISQYGLDETRQNKIRAVKESRDYAVNIGNVKMQKGGLQSQFFSLDPNDMTDSELDEYNSLLTEAIRSEGNFIFSNNFVDFTIKNKARLADELMQNELSSHWIDKMSDLNNRMFRNVPFVRQAVSRLVNPFGYGLAENYNMKDYLNFFDGIQNDYSGNMVKTIFQPLEDAHDKQRAILKDLFTKMNEFRANKDKTKNLTEGDFHTIGIYWLLSQKPDIKITEDYFNVETDPETGENTSLLERLGFNQEDITGLLGMTLRADEFHEKDNNGVWKEKQGIDKERYKLYQAILNNRMQYLRDSVMISFGEKPEWMDEKDFKSHLKKQLNDPYFLLQAEIDLHTGESNMLKQIFSQLQQKKLELLKNTGAKTVAEVVDNIINKQLAGRQDEFISLAISAFDKLQEGEHTDGVTMKDMAQNYTNKSEREFVAIKNYAPIIRNVTSSIEGIKPLENEAGAISEADGKWGIRTGINISNQFTKTRNQNVSTLETNAFKMIEKRFDQELFYMMNEPHRLFLKELLNKTDGAFSSIDKKVDRDGNVVSSEDDHKSSDYIKNMITLYYRRNMTPAKLDLKNSKVTGGIHELLQTYRIATLAPMRSSFGQITSTFMSQENMFGGYADRFQDMASGFTDLFSDSDEKNRFLEQYGAEVLNRGLTDYDLGQGKEHLNFGNLTNRYFKGEFDSEDGDIKSFWKSMKDKGIPTEKALMPLVFFDRTAARATFFGAYRNYCRHYGIKVDFVNPDEDAVNFANSTVRKTQNTDNELYKTGVLAGVSTENNGRDTFLPVGKGTAAYELLRQGYWNFKSFAIAEQNNIAIKFIKAFHAEKLDPDNIIDAISAIGYNFVGKMLYNYVKSASKALFTGTGLYIAYLANMGHLGDGDDENIIKELITGEFSKAKEKSNNAKDKAIANAKQVWQNEISGTSIVERDAYKEGLVYNATKSILDEFQVNEFSGQISSLLMKSLHESTLDDNQEVGDRMNKLYKQADEIDMMSLITKVFGVSLTGAVFGDKVERNSEISHLQDVITSIKNKDTENIGYNDMTSVWLFLSQIAGFNLFGRLPLSYPSIRKWTEDIDKYNRQQTDMLNTKIQDKKEKEEDEIPVENYSPDEEN